MAETTNGQGDRRLGQTPDRLRLRPGASVFQISPDELQVAFPNYTATFTSPPVVRGVAALLELLRAGTARTTAVAAAAAAVAHEPAFIDYLVTLLLNSRCLYAEPALSNGQCDRNPVGDFYAYLGDEPERVRSLLAARPVVVIGPDGEDLDGAAARAGLQTAIVRLVAGATCGSVLTAVRHQLDAGATALACWNVPYRLPLARLVNDLAIERGVPVLFGACEGVVGRIGPYVLPGNSACLECANVRLLSHAGAAELRAHAHYRARYEDLIPEPWPSHPLFAESISGLFLLELAQILSDQPPQTLGGFIEHTFPGGTAQRHPVHRVPSCPSCHPSKPQRLAWDVRFPAPAVKTSAG